MKKEMVYTNIVFYCFFAMIPNHIQGECMYTYTQTFFGVPLSQFYGQPNENFKEILQGLTSLDTIENVLSLNVDEYLKSYKATSQEKQWFVLFLEWMNLHTAELKELGFYFASNYHGGDEYPMIFGAYGGISLPDAGCEQIDTSGFNEVVKTEKQVKQLFSTMPQELIDAFPYFGKAGFWANDHSS